MYDLWSWLSRRVRPRAAEVARSCIFDERYGCIIPAEIPTQNLGTTFDFQAMALNCGYRGGKDDWWHIHHSGPAREGAFARNCPHSYRPGHVEEAVACDCMGQMENEE
ncbi:MAG: hypothetical protein KDD73_11110 [Anaerolineales bacterium]|nr:hypothetical protein [Anaerolineales bacterium]MCB9126927.1 hypothetical protein [Ardenticatenales bacterium]MCB9171471.1 hypothetical protein [Ardenticatenales bacterium]